ncbi:MAG: phosphodiester glycosidase family protein [Clostridia bacterium]|nr:phosphodiester glycosidase family protein [Clostridia bacterium]MCR5694516.1 phosphodiester glycosidase family protein [Clostridia bacterium]
MKNKDKGQRNTKETLKKAAVTVGKVFVRLLAVVLSVVIAALVTLMGAIYIISKSDSDVVKELFVTSMVDTGALDFCAHMFLSDEEVNEILAKNQIVVPEGKTNTTLIVIGEKEKDPVKEKEDEEKDKANGIVYNEQGVCVIDIKGKTYVGKALIVKDPSRVKVAGLAKYGEGIVGKTTEQMAKEANALAATNAGGYREMSDYRTGGIPEGRDSSGLVIIDGELKWGSKSATYEVIGFDNDNVLHIDNMTGEEALRIGIRDAVNWGPVLVKNGEPCVVPTTGSNIGFHPRTAIGQRADGSVILVVIDGRQAHSVGASYTDLVEIFMRYEAVNAANLDGGMSSYMYYDGEVITRPYMLYFSGRRTVATSIIVTKLEDGD